MCMCGCRNLYYPYSSIILYGFMGRFQQGCLSETKLTFRRSNIKINGFNHIRQDRGMVILMAAWSYILRIIFNIC